MIADVSEGPECAMALRAFSVLPWILWGEAERPDRIVGRGAVDDCFCIRGDFPFVLRDGERHLLLADDQRRALIGHRIAPEFIVWSCGRRGDIEDAATIGKPAIATADRQLLPPAAVGIDQPNAVELLISLQCRGVDDLPPIGANRWAFEPRALED